MCLSNNGLGISIPNPREINLIFTSNDGPLLMSSEFFWPSIGGT